MSGTECHTWGDGTLALDRHTDTLVITQRQLDTAGDNSSAPQETARYFSDLAQTRFLCAAAAVVATIAGYAVLFPM